MFFLPLVARVSPYPRSLSASCPWEPLCVTSCYECRAGNIRLPKPGVLSPRPKKACRYIREYIVTGSREERPGGRGHPGEQADGLRAIVERRDLAHQSAQGGRRSGLAGAAHRVLV